MTFSEFYHMLAGRSKELWLRIVLMGGIQLINMILAYLVLPAKYGQIALAAFVVKNCHQAVLGLSQGYIYAHFNLKGKYLGTYAPAYLVLGLIYIIATSLFMDMPLALAGIALVVIFLVEPYLRVRREFSVILIPEFYFLVAVLAATAGSMLDIDISEPLAVFSLCSIFTALFILRFWNRSLKDFLQEATGTHFSWRNFMLLVRSGSQAYFSTILAFFVLVIDRAYITEMYGDSVLGTFMLAFQFCLAITLLSSLFNATSVVDFGELMQGERKTMLVHLRNRYNISLFVNAVLWFAIIGFLFVFAQILFPEFEGLLIITAALGIGIVAQAAFNAVSPVLFHLDKQFITNIFFAAVLVAKVAAYHISFEAGLTAIPAIVIQSGILFVGVTGSSLYLYRVVKQ
ncbi:hypothetical protein [Parasphingorhabdus sp.]|uniref:hypothetical protein n=1 Tax=Parasphingorhabdus sp. TaxID=2709688 RepID=UPI003A8E27F2